MKDAPALSVTDITKIAILVLFENSSQSWRDINESRHSLRIGHKNQLAEDYPRDVTPPCGRCQVTK